MADEHLKSMMDNLYWWGIPTMFRCPNEGPQGQDIALAGRAAFHRQRHD